MKNKNGLLALLVLPLTIALAGALAFGGASAWAQTTQYEGDGARQNATGGWDTPYSTAGPGQGSCWPDASLLTRPECLAQRFPAYTTSAACTGAGTAPNTYSWSTGVCNDLINTADEAACEAQPGRLWSNGICAITMKGRDRNAAVCGSLGGTWNNAGTCTGSWVMPNSSTFNPPLLTGTTGPGPGDQCLRCHRSDTEWNGPRVRDVETYLRTGHKNMSRKATAGSPWAGPTSYCSNPLYVEQTACETNGGTWSPVYPTDTSGNLFDWAAGTIQVSGSPASLYWIYDGWLEDPHLPSAIYAAGSNATTGKPLMSYSCARCHTTGWTSDAALMTGKEPEKSFPGVTWDGVTLNTTGKVNLASGVTGDTNTKGSWDLFGITCTRCHSSAVNNTGGAPPYSAPTGMSSHHSALTSPDAGSGYCTDSRFTASAQCTAAGGTWLTACSDGVSATQLACQTAGQTWYVPYCTVPGGATPGTCSNAVFNNNPTGCAAAPAPTTWQAQLTVAGTTVNADIVSCQDAGGTWTGSKTQRGQIITALCMQCHRQETGGYPYGTTVTGGVPDYSGTDPGQQLKVGPYHNTVTFPSHYHGNQFLNSPHGKFSGKANQIATAKYGAGYGSYFLMDGEARNTGNGCTGCHNVHKSTVPSVGHAEPVKECTECHNKDLHKLQHPNGAGTPLENPAEACVTCHMPGGEHLFRISSDASYSTFPTSAFALASGVVNANTAPHGTYSKAVWVDLDRACGQCHGGGTSTASTTGSIAGGLKTLTVSSATGFATGERVTIAGAALKAGRPVTFETYVASVSGNTVTLVGAASATVAGAAVELNPTRNGAGYMSKAELAVLAKGIHNDGPTVVFGYKFGGTNPLNVAFDASASTCSGSPLACNAYSWSFGDGAAGSGRTVTHAYAAAGSYAVTLTVTQYGVGSASASKVLNLTAGDAPPVAAGTCTFDANTWTETVTDASTDDHGVAQVTVAWGDGTALASDTTAPFGPFTHTYLNAGSFTLTHKAIDTAGQTSSVTCAAAPALFTVSGTVYRSDGSTPVSAATVKLKKGTLVKTVMTAADGTFSAGSLKPGTYTVTVTKTGYTFANPAATVTVGPSGTLTINAATP